MEHESEIIELNVRDYISPECACKIEDIANNIPHVLESTFDPVSNRLKVKAHREQGLEVAMLTGDNKQTAAYVAKELGLNTFFGEVLPDQKANSIKTLQSQGKRVAMVGD